MRNLSFLFSAIKGGYLYRKNLIKLKSNLFFINILILLYNEGYINGFFVENQTVTIFLKYYYNKPLLISFKNISKTSHRQYYQIKKINKIFKNGLSDTLIISSNQGLLTSKESIFNSIGGELLCIISN